MAQTVLVASRANPHAQDMMYLALGRAVPASTHSACPQALAFPLICALAALTTACLPAPTRSYCGLPAPAGMEILVPTSEPPTQGFPTIVFHHGVGKNWSAMGPDMLEAADAGYVAVSLNTRTSASIKSLPTRESMPQEYYRAAREIRCAIRQLRHDGLVINNDSAKRPIDPTRIALAGFSMGGVIGYHAVLPTHAPSTEPGAQTVLEAQFGPDPLAAYYPDESGTPNAYIAMSAAPDPIAAATGCAILHSSMLARKNGEIALDADGRAIRASFLNPRRDRSEQHVCGSDLSAEQARARIAGSMAKTYHDLFTETFEKPLLVASSDRESAYQSTWVSTVARTEWERLNALSLAPRSAGDPPPVPVLIQHGDADDKAPPSSASTTFDLLVHLGYTTRLLLYPDVKHTWHPSDSSMPDPQRSQRNTQTLRFLDHVLGWRPRATLPTGKVGDVAKRMQDIAKTFALPSGFTENDRTYWVTKAAAAYVAGRDLSITVKCEDSTPSGICEDLADEATRRSN